MRRSGRLDDIPGFNIDRVAAAAGDDPDVLRLENLDTDVRRPRQRWRPPARRSARTTPTAGCPSMTGWGGEVADRYLRLVFSNEPVDRLGLLDDRMRAALG